MGHDSRGRGGARSIHDAALDNLRRGTKPVLFFFAAVFGVMALFTLGGFVVVKQNMPTPPAGSEDGAAASASPSPGSSSSGGADVWRDRLVAFLTDAAEAEQAGSDRWFPGAAAETDGLTYTPLSSADPGADRPDGLARVSYRGLPAADAKAVLAAVSRDGKVVPSSLAVSKSSGTDKSWTLSFVVKTRSAKGKSDGDWLEGEAEGYSKPSGATVILRLIYSEAKPGVGG
ncbi:hypothetical protein GCM10011579_039750 [Streptomyces albiflavescens]|uniref:Uncharacterized protein n=1 Tax=Streptomyces albiflavescens TaxID=1623582 RepID=A0A917Y5K9_9ACTN|nr:hypothetical protein [Streptomyces albiflavescens]GGN67334.1 hypothetical protein GCM10011579_039750 [Streptomyces albiflavescens]